MATEFVTIHHLNGVSWIDAPVPRRWHFCRIQTWGMVGVTMYARCACGAVRSELVGHWTDKNSRRRGNA